jgi:hypothetical protein
MQHSSTEVTPAKISPDGPNADALLAWLHLLRKAEEAEDELPPYASPPCYLAEFSAADLSDHPAK